MGYPILGIGSSQGKNLDSVKSLPDFRKATRNMILSHLALQEALQSFDQAFLTQEIKNFGLILGSSSGELDTTVQFLDYLGNTGVARPLLFQNSLHNSTVGFLAMKLGITGPSFALSNLDSTGENCIETAIQLLEEESCHFAAVVTAEGEVPRLQINTDGAAALILTRKDVSEKLNLRPLASLSDLSHRSDPSKTHWTNKDSEMSADLDSNRQFDFYSTDAISQVIRALQNDPISSPLLLKKLNGSVFQIKIERA